MSQTTTLAPEVLDDNGAPVICPTLHHTGTQTARKDEMVRWYRNVLGQRSVLDVGPPSTVFDTTFTSNDLEHHRMGFLAIPGTELEPSKTSPGIQHVAWRYESIDDMLASWKRIKDLGIEPSFCTGRAASFAFYYRDPDQNLVEVRCDRYREPGQGLAAMRSDVLQANAAGTAVDPAKVYEAWSNGASLDELYERAAAGEFKAEGGKVHDYGSDQLEEQWTKNRDD